MSKIEEALYIHEQELKLQLEEAVAEVKSAENALIKAKAAVDFIGKRRDESAVTTNLLRQLGLISK